MLGVAALLGAASAAGSTARDVEVHALPASLSVHIDVDLATASTWDHYAERMVGTSHIAMNARADWREHLAMVAKDLGAKYVRGHGMFDNDMHVSYARGLNSWVSLDSYVDFLLSIDMLPAFELGFSPDWMATNNTLVGRGSPQTGPNGRIGSGYGYRANMSPPNNTLWGEFIGDYAKHLVSRYGEDICSTFIFEVWNEPQWAFAGSMEHYFEMYAVTARALKAVSPRLRVGGPATSEDMINVSATTPSFGTAWIGNFTQYCRKHDVPFDFVSNHNYAGCGEQGTIGNVDNLLRAQRDARAVIGNETPFVITEFGAACTQGAGVNASMAAAAQAGTNGGGGADGYPGGKVNALDGFANGGWWHDVEHQAAFVIAAVDALAAGGYESLSYWAFTDVFEESFWPVKNVSFHGMFGLVNLQGVPKPTYRAYQLLHQTGNTRHAVRTTPVGAGISNGCGQSIGALAISDYSDPFHRHLDVLVYNHVDDVQTSTSCVVTVELANAVAATSGAGGAPNLTAASVRRIDASNANAYTEWVQMGMPQDLLPPAQVAQLKSASALTTEPLRLGSDRRSVTLAVPLHGVAAVRLELS